MNTTFARYATRTAFNLTLSKTQVETLFLIANRRYLPIHNRYMEMVTARRDCFVPGARALCEKGLIIHRNVPSNVPSFRLTSEGRHVYELCEAAGLFSPIREAYNLKEAAPWPV